MLNRHDTILSYQKTILETSDKTKFSRNIEVSDAIIRAVSVPQFLASEIK